MKVIVTGGGGQLGRCLLRRGTATAVEIVALGRDALDVTDPARITAALAAHRPDAVIHAAAFTDVDRAELDRERAWAVNARGAELVARACAECRIPLWYVSTDHVFDGSATRPYREDDPTAPVNTYGISKAEGERVVRASGGTVVRTAWLFGRHGSGFVHAVVRRAREQRVLRVVADQYGSPTWGDDLADALLQLARERPAVDVVHVCGDGPVSRHAFAEAIVGELGRHAAVVCERIEPIASTDRSSPARRPRYTVLDTTRARRLGIPIRPWRDGLRAMLSAEVDRR